MKAYLCRHGETVCNSRGKKQGLIDSRLTPLGLKQASQMAKVLSGAKPAAVYCSRAFRAIDTAEIIAKAHKLKPSIVPELHEIDLGKFEGLTIEERRKLYAKEDDARNKDKFNIPFPGGENYVMVKERVKPFIDKVKEKHAQDEIIIVSHQATSRVLLAMLAGLSNEDILRTEMLHNMFYEIDLNATKSKISYILNGKRNEGVLYRG